VIPIIEETLSRYLFKSLSPDKTPARSTRRAACAGGVTSPTQGWGSLVSETQLFEVPSPVSMATVFVAPSPEALPPQSTRSPSSARSNTS
jgi:hypothetical protein